jgi:hypothetical protein
MARSGNNGHSSDVSLRLIVGDRVIPLASLGRGMCTAKMSVSEMPESDAELVVDVDGDIARYFVHVDRVRAGSRQITFSCHDYIPVAHAERANAGSGMP